MGLRFRLNVTVLVPHRLSAWRVKRIDPWKYTWSTHFSLSWTAFTNLVLFRVRKSWKGEKKKKKKEHNQHNGINIDLDWRTKKCPRITCISLLVPVSQAVPVPYPIEQTPPAARWCWNCSAAGPKPHQLIPFPSIPHGVEDEPVKAGQPDGLGGDGYHVKVHLPPWDLWYLPHGGPSGCPYLAKKSGCCIALRTLGCPDGLQTLWEDQGHLSSCTKLLITSKISSSALETPYHMKLCD